MAKIIKDKAAIRSMYGSAAYVDESGRVMVYGRNIKQTPAKQKSKRPAPTIDEIWSTKGKPTAVVLESQVQEF